MSEEDHVLFLPLVDEEAACLPLPINVVSRYWNVQLPMKEALDVSRRYAGFAGSIMIEGIELATRYGLPCVVTRATVQTLKTAIDVGIPPIVILPGVPGVPEITQHASVVSGYDEDSIFHYVQTGTEEEGVQQEGVIPTDVFEQGWSEEGRLMILVAPADVMSSLPAGAPAVSEACRLCFDAERSIILNDKQGASTLLQEALRLDPENPAALQMLGGLLNEQNSSECARYYNRCIQTNSRAYLAYNGLGNYHLKNSRFAEAESCYTQAIGINPKRSARIYKNRAYLREKQNDADGAADDLRTYLRNLPGAPDRGAMEKVIRELCG